MTIVRLASPQDLPILHKLIPDSVRALSQDHYTPVQIESALQFVFGPDTQLIENKTYYVAEAVGIVVGCGGWSRRRTLYGGDQSKTGEDALLGPATEAARIRAFFVHLDWVRRGVARQILAVCLDAARAAGFQRLELMATLPGVPLYQAFGFQAGERVEVVLPDGFSLPFVPMSRDVTG